LSALAGNVGRKQDGMMQPDPSSLYEEDFYAWTQAQARALRRFADGRSNLPLDLPHLAEEIADLGKEQRNALRSWATRIIEHLLLLQHSPAEEPRRHWTRAVILFRREIETRLTPTLRADLRRRLPQLHADARRGLVIELSRHDEAAVAERLPETCPFTLEQVLKNWWPGG
jgi:hypothetical protein